MADAVVIGSGPNGLVAANVLADEGWSVVVLEANDQPGGAVRSAEVTAPGYVSDLFSSFYPLGVGSPVIRDLDLERHGLRWTQAPRVLAHPTPEGRAAVLSTDLDETAAALDGFAAGDGDAWRELYALWERIGDALLESLLRPFPPVRGAARLITRLTGVTDALELARLAVLPVRRLAEERFTGAGGGLLLAGCALHADLTPESALGTMFGIVLAGIGQQMGWPVPVGGAQCLTEALVARLASRGGELVTGARVTDVIVRGGRATGVRTADGREVDATRAVLADVAAPRLYLDLVGREHVPARVTDAISRFQPGTATVKVDWAVSAPIPWKDSALSEAGTVHIADSMDELSATSMELATGRVPARPFLLVGQMTTADPSRSPAGTESAWGYTHVPQNIKADAGDSGITGAWDASDTERFVDRMEQRIEDYAPGFRDLIAGRHVFTPRGLEESDANLIGGDIGGGTSQLHQQLIFRPIAGFARPETPIRGLYLASASAHPGGGVHGACGANAARAAIAHDRLAARALSIGGGLAAAAAVRRMARRKRSLG